MIPDEIRTLAPFAADGDREDPSEHKLLRKDGWPVRYEQIGSDSEPERTVFQQLIYELELFITERRDRGLLPWDARSDYIHPAFVTRDGALRISLQSSGPANGGAVDPAALGQTHWRIY